MQFIQGCTLTPTIVSQVGQRSALLEGLEVEKVHWQSVCSEH